MQTDPGKTGKLRTSKLEAQLMAKTKKVKLKSTTRGTVYFGVEKEK